MRFERSIFLFALMAVTMVTVKDCVQASSPAATVAALEPIELGQPIRIDVQPSRIHLDSARCTVRVLVTAHYADGRVQDVTRVAVIHSQQPEIARIEGQKDAGPYVMPLRNGVTEITVEVAGHQMQMPVEVSHTELPDHVSFQRETLAALTKQGCNSGGCHGTPSGKGGFRLSLEAYDPALDELTLIRESLGRRCNPIDPEQSLLLRKPTLDVAHGGGRRIRRSDRSYEVLKNWIAEGCQIDPATAPHCVQLEILPGRSRTLTWPAHTQQLLVIAHYSDGSQRDVTDLAKLTSSDNTVASVSPLGMVVGRGRGEAAIMVRYLEHLESILFTFVKPVDGFVWNSPPENNYVDTLVYRKLKQMQYLPADLCDDSEFIRRVHMDVIGVPPTVEESQQFLANTSSDKRSQLVNALLERDEYAQFWAQKWADLLRVRDKNLSPEGVQKFYTWLVDAFRANMPFDEFSRALLTAQGSTFVRPQANYYRTLKDATASVEATAQLFLGVRIQCAKCHNHPFERWTQDNYYGLSAFFNRVQQKSGSRAGETVVWVSRQGDVVQPRTGKTMQPWLPLTGIVEGESTVDRRVVLAQWLTRDDNPFFAKVGVNRIWAHVMGRGIVEPVDDFRDSNPPANKELLESLAAEFQASGFDQKQMLRTILTSRVYQHSAQTNDFNCTDEKYFSHAQVRLLTAEQLLDAIGYLTEKWESFPGVPAEMRATQLPSPDANHEFLKMFGQPDRETSCACERTSDSNLTQALQLFNGSLVHNKLRDSDNRFRRNLAAGKSDGEVLNDLYLAAYSRGPSPAEIQTAIKHLDAQTERVLGWEDICWSLINSKEFLFRH